jgi:MFS family permease
MRRIRARSRENLSGFVIPATYRELWRIRAIRLPVTASIVGRLPLGSLGLALLFLVKDTTGSFADAGVVEATFSLGVAVGLPGQGRLVDRLGQAPVLVPAALLNAIATLALVLVARGGAPLVSLAALGALIGLSLPPISSCMRGLWASLTDDAHALQSAYALDAVILELAFITGPLIAAGLTAAVSASAAMLVSGALTLVGTLAFAASTAARRWAPSGSAGDWAGPLRSSGIRVLAASAAGLGFANGALVFALSAFGAEHSAPEIAGPMIAIQAVASMVGGIWYGARQWHTPASERYPRLNLLLALGFAPLALATSVPALAALMVLAGLALAPTTAVLYVLVERVTPRGTSTEAFGWLITATVIGSGLGAAIAGAVVQNGHVVTGFLIALAGAVGGWLAATAGRPALADAEA